MLNFSSQNRVDTKIHYKICKQNPIWHGVRSSTKIIYTVIELTYFFVLIPFHRHKKNHEGKELIIYPG